MSKNLGNLNIEVSMKSFKDSAYNSKIIFHNLENFLRDKGFPVRSTMTRSHGRGTDLAVRTGSNAITYSMITMPVEVEITDHEDTKFNHRVILHGLTDGLRKHGVIIDTCEVRGEGQEKPIGIRVLI